MPSIFEDVMYRFPHRFAPIQETVPFNYREGMTYLQALQKLRDWIYRDMIPTIDGKFTDFAEKIDIVIAELETAIQAAEQYANDAAAAATSAEASADSAAADAASATADAATVAAIKAAIDVIYADIQEMTDGLSQDTIVNGIITNLDSVTRATLDGLYARTEGEVIDIIDDDIQAERAGTLYQTIDERFVARPKSSDIAVAIGSSNNTGPTSPSALVCEMLGVDHRNFSVGGGALTNGNFNSQLAAARDSGAFANADVRWVFIVDVSNDVRSKASDYEGPANTLLSNARNWFPNAQIVFVPILWPPYERNFPSEIGGWQFDWRTLAVRAGRILREIAWAHDAIYADYSWTWHAATQEYQVEDEVHFTLLGRELSARNIYAVIRHSADTRYRSGWRNVVGLGNGVGNQAGDNVPGLALSRDGDEIYVRGRFNAGGATVAANTNIFSIPLPVWPNATARFFAHMHGTGDAYPFIVYGLAQGGGQIQTAASLPANAVFYANSVINWA